MVRVTGELDCFSAHIRLREPDRSEDKAEGGTSVESSIPCSHGGRALVIKGTKEVENTEANSKYQDRTEPSNLTFSTTKRMGEVEYSSSLTYPAEELCINSVIGAPGLDEDGVGKPQRIWMEKMKEVKRPPL
ncbi:hypothetical protein GW17_00015570 [Ensete ventricosum]|nr:hypothetical protein GW17_00015570 [Ensete ventricosum]